MHARRLQCQYNFAPRNIVAIDETAVWNDSFWNYCRSYGAKDVPMKSTEHEKVRISVCLAAKSDGTKQANNLCGNKKD